MGKILARPRCRHTLGGVRPHKEYVGRRAGRAPKEPLPTCSEEVKRRKQSIIEECAMDPYTEEVVACLRDLGSSNPTTIDLEEGICFNLEAQGQAATSIYELCADWNYFSGSRSCPIPVTDHRLDTAVEQYFSQSSKKWEGRQGELRRSLCLHVAHELERRLLSHNKPQV